MIIVERQQPLPTAKDAFADGSGKTSHISLVKVSSEQTERPLPPKLSFINCNITSLKVRGKTKF